ncbi:MAG: AAA family ATPase [Clostridiales bacterium]|nr:AAA family ATPase [Clostridiales bacterium]
MGYLYLNFMDNLERGSRSWDDFYTLSLNEQYEALKPRLGNFAADNLQEFIASAFPLNDKFYYVSLPGFDRRIKENRRSKQCIYNIVIRPEKDVSLSYRLPKNYDLIIIGDVTFGNVIDITVKGIELIDINVAKFGERKVYCTAACAFMNRSFVANGKSITVPDYGVREMHNPVLTNDFVNALCTELYPVPNPQKALTTFDEWQKYIKFRRYYLGKQSERCEQAECVTVCNSYMITKDIYRRNEDSYSELLLDNLAQFSKGEQIILSKEVSGAVGFPLIRIDVERNRKSVLSDTLSKNGKGKPKFEVWLQRYTKDSMGLSTTPPRYDENGDLPKGVRFFQYSLGERYLFAYVDIEPDCTALEKKYEKDLLAAYERIDIKYQGIITAELIKFKDGQAVILKAQYDKKLAEYKSSHEAALERDIAENKDKEVIKDYESEIAKQLAPIETEYKKQIKAIDAEIDKIKKDKSDKEQKKAAIAVLEEKKNALEEKFEGEKKSVRQSLSLRSFYISRNAKLVENKRKSISIAMQAELDRLKNERKSQLEVQYKGPITNEKADVKRELHDKLGRDKADKIESETVRRYQIYFRPNDITDTISEIKKEIETYNTAYLTYDNRAEKAKIERQEKALNSFLCGYVKNPYLPAYLFAPETLAQTVRAVQEDPEMCWESLNDRQKTAVKRALASESLFLLQGPPGTGKTQVIAEITAQLARQGKKVLISSETHKAIDNVFERLPKIPEIRPLRLIPSQNGKETNYSPERLVDNFYANISGNLERQVRRFEHFEETKATFDEEMKLLRREYDRLLRLNSENAKIKSERQSISNTVNILNEELQSLRDQLALAREHIEEHRRTIKYIESCRPSTEGAKEQYIEAFIRKLEELLSGFACLESVSVDKVGELNKADIGAIKEELALFLSEDTVLKLKNRQRDLRKILQDLRDPDTDEVPPENLTEYKKHQAELINVGNQIKTAQNSSSVDLSASLIYSLVPTITNDSTLLKSLPEELTAFKIKLQTLVAEMKADVEKAMVRYLKEENSLTQKISEKQLEISDNKRRYEELGENKVVEEYGELDSALRQKITRFFRNFAIVREYDTSNLETAFDIIKEEWDKLERDYKKTQKENQTKIPTYRAICKYLSQEDILEEDRQAYTRELYNCVNVFGITCTSRDKFTPTQLKELANYGIESVDIRTQGIDVVIIDEVSKSSLLDLLIPILYGKTVILVGDHRQLPPMYDLRHLREEDFEGLDSKIISKKINEGYTALYEECFFKTLYEKVPDEFRVMLNKQYRCHSHIMEVFNHFYGGSQKGLTVGKQHQDDEKQHNLTVRIGGNTIIDPNHHIYFVDCDQRESSAYEGSTSKINEQESEVAISLMRELDKAAGELVKAGKLKFDKDKKIDERPSMGVICTYGDQAGHIKKMRGRAQFTGFSQKQDERLIISTVDDFQGDERDIIIVSMVRNPAPGKRYDAEFIKKFERINVALSRARKLLIIVGSKRFLSEAGVIDLPDLEGKKALDKVNFHVYKEIIDTIYFRGRVLTASDIIGGDNGR